LAYSNVYLKGKEREIVPNIIGFSTNEIISKEVDNANIEASLRENTGKEAITQRWEKLSDVKD